MHLMLMISLAIAGAGAPWNAQLLASSTKAASADTAASLAATTAPPWNPPEPLARRRGWERAVNAPGRLLSLPLSALGHATEAGMLYVEERGYLPTGPMIKGPKSRRKISVSSPRLGGRAGFGASVEARQTMFTGRPQTDFSVRYAGTTRFYNGTFVTAAGRPLMLQYGSMWRPQERFFGIGPKSSVNDFSDYGSQVEYLRLELGRPMSPGLPVHPGRTRVSAWSEMRYQVTRVGHEFGEPSFEERFPELAAATLDREVEHLIYGASIANDTRAGVPHWSHGVRVAASAERHDAPLSGLALRVGSPGGAQFNRFQYEAETGFSFMRSPRTVRLFARVVDQDVTAGGDRFLISDLSTLGGTSGLGGYAQGRFRDMDLMLLKGSYIFPISRRLELDLHSEWGSVYGDVWRDAAFGTLHDSYGIALRGCYVTGPIASIGLDWSREGVRLAYAFGGVQ